ncbi:hypothetical protein F5050DRAFT_1900732 [Lentinula boryana]|uniref:Uncharacterized protein n=1 Tax=Lentinula boryana TaxID=40481 RepID=A0ABQ8QM43_9AGAR|nr:hypothetical protein F5050DRAFT_1900732 [Lentinula boryana]
MNHPKQPQTPQNGECLPRSSASAGHSHTSQFTTISGVYFPGASKLSFSGRSEFNSIKGDLYLDHTGPENIEEDPPDASQQENLSSSRSSRRGPNPQRAPNTSFEGTFFPGASGLQFSGEQRFNNVEGTMVKTYRSRHSTGNDASAQKPRTSDPPQKGHKKPSPSSSQPPPNTSPSQGINGDFFAGVHDAVFAGRNEFNAVDHWNDDYCSTEVQVSVVIRKKGLTQIPPAPPVLQTAVIVPLPVHCGTVAKVPMSEKVMNGEIAIMMYAQ